MMGLNQYFKDVKCNKLQGVSFENRDSEAARELSRKRSVSDNFMAGLQPYKSEEVRLNEQISLD